MNNTYELIINDMDKRINYNFAKSALINFYNKQSVLSACVDVNYKDLLKWYNDGSKFEGLENFILLFPITMECNNFDVYAFMENLVNMSVNDCNIYLYDSKCVATQKWIRNFPFIKYLKTEYVYDVVGSEKIFVMKWVKANDIKIAKPVADTNNMVNF